MKGVIFNVLEEAVTHEHGVDTWHDLLDNTGLHGIWSSLGSYPDAEILTLVDTAAQMLGIAPTDVLRWFGRAAIPLLAERYETFFSPHRSARPFIMGINDVIHPEVRKLYAGAACPHFHFHQLDDGRLGMAYRSPRRLCHLAHGFIEGAAAHYGETIEVEHLSCMLDDHPVCRIALEWMEPARA
ncbi:MAG: hypothetical protein RIS94_2368 [Pseudomonadota bacterium]